jgi:hypothetical protein
MTKTSSIQQGIGNLGEISAISSQTGVSLASFGIVFINGQPRIDQRFPFANNITERLNNDFKSNNEPGIQKHSTTNDLSIYSDKDCWYLVCKDNSFLNKSLSIIAIPKCNDDHQTLKNISKGLLPGGPAFKVPGSVGLLRCDILTDSIAVDCIQTCISKNNSPLIRAFNENKRELKESDKEKRGKLLSKYIDWRQSAFEILLYEARAEEKQVCINIDPDKNKSLSKATTKGCNTKRGYRYSDLTKSLMSIAHGLGFVSYRLGSSQIRFIPRMGEKISVPNSREASIDPLHPVCDAFGEPLSYALEDPTSADLQLKSPFPDPLLLKNLFAKPKF